jgi:hypothetical protein
MLYREGSGKAEKGAVWKGRKEENEIKDHSKIVKPLKASSGPPGGPSGP